VSQAGWLAFGPPLARLLDGLGEPDHNRLAG